MTATDDRLDVTTIPADASDGLASTARFIAHTPAIVIVVSSADGSHLFPTTAATGTPTASTPGSVRRIRPI
jgi:hypothetical protein